MITRDTEALLINSLNAAILGEVGWETFLGRLASILPNGKATLSFYNTARAAGAYTLHSGFDKDFLHSYSAYYSARNPWMPKVVQRPLGLGTPVETMLPRTDLLKTEFYADFLRPQGLVSGIGVTIGRDEQADFLLGVLCDDVDEQIALQSADLIARVSHHIHRLFAASRRNVIQEAKEGMIPSLSARKSNGLMLVDEQLRPCFIDEKAEGILSANRGIGVSPTGHIRFVSEQANALLAAMLTRPGIGRADAPTAKSLILVDRARLPALRLTLLPFGLTSDPLNYFAGPMLLIVLDDLKAPLQLDGHEFRETLGLSAAEAELVAGLACGRTVNELTRLRDVSAGTIRSQLHAVYAKVGVKGQSELLLLALRASGHLRA